jgi:hypothetical protein
MGISDIKAARGGVFLMSLAPRGVVLGTEIAPYLIATIYVAPSIVAAATYMVTIRTSSNAVRTERVAVIRYNRII